MPEGALSKTLEKGNKEFPGGSSKYIKLEEGDNKIRIVSVLQVYGRHFIDGEGYKTCIGGDEGCQYCASPNEQIKKIGATYFGWCIDRKDGKIKETELSYTLLKSIDDVTTMDEHHFVPEVSGIFPYDLNIRKISGKTKNEKTTYNIIPSARTELSEMELEEVKKLRHPMVVVEEKKGRKSVEGAEDNQDIKVEDIPF